jgi:drug/metabolite transporter (DMT)-like permease
MVTVFALAAALLYGSADFLGGAATRRAHVLSVLAVSITSGAVIALAAALLSGEPPRLAGLAWGACAGVAGAIGFMFFYTALGAGPMSVVAPVSALTATVLPLAVALAGGERPGPAVYAGSVTCIAAIVLVSTGGGAEEADSAAGTAGRQRGRARTAARGIAFGTAAGAAFGVFFLFIRNGGETGSLWPVAAARVTETLVVLAAAIPARIRPVSRQSGRVFAAALGAGVGDVAANICYVLATRAGLFGLAVVLTSLYPGVTVLAARLVLRERLGLIRAAGLALAVTGIILITAGS